MKFKSLAVVIFASSAQAALANPYQIEATMIYADIHDVSTWAVGGEYYFKQVDTEGHLLEEAWFLESASSVGLAYSMSDSDGGDLNTLAVNLSYFVPNLPVYIGLQHYSFDADGYSDTNWEAILGYSAGGLLIYTTYNEDTDYEPNLYFKYVSESGSGTGFNAEAGVTLADEGEDVYGAAFDYYVSRTTNFGVVLQDSDDTSYGVRARHFFLPEFSGGVSYMTQDDYDSYILELNLRF